MPRPTNLCVASYPSDDNELELNQIDFLRQRYPTHTIGFSTHEYHDWNTSIAIAYGKGARTFERHVDIDDGAAKVSPYCSLPEQIDDWFRTWNRVRSMCGAPGTQRRMIPEKEMRYLDSLIRGVYAKRDLPVGHILGEDDVYMAVPLQKQQLSCRELMFVLPEDQKLTAGYNVVVCEVCGAAFADTTVRQRHYDELYAQQSRYAAGPAAHASDNDRDIARFRDMAAAVGRRVPDRSARIVDVGRADGQMLAALAQPGFPNLSGLDPSHACAPQA